MNTQGRNLPYVRFYVRLFVFFFGCVYVFFCACLCVCVCVHGYGCGGMYIGGEACVYGG